MVKLSVGLHEGGVARHMVRAFSMAILDTQPYEMRQPQVEMKDRRTIKDWERAIDFSDEEWELICLADQNGVLLRPTATFDVLHVTPDERKDFFRLLKQLVTERNRLRGMLDRAGIHPRPITTELKPR